MARQEKTTIGLLRRFTRGGTRLIVLSLLLYTISIGINLFPPFFQQVFTDEVITGRNPSWFKPLMTLYVALFLLELLAWTVINASRRKNEMSFSIISQSRYLWHALRLPVATYQRYSAGDLLARFRAISTTGVNLFDLAPAMVLVINLVIFSYLLFIYNWKLGAIEIAALATIVLAIRLTTDYQKRKARDMEATERHLNSATMAGMQSIDTIKSEGAEPYFYRRWDELYVKALNARVAATRQIILMGALPILVQQISAAMLLCLGTWFILEGELTPGMLLASQGFMNAMLYPVTKLSTTMQDVYKAHSVLERQEEVLEEPLATILDDNTAINNTASDNSQSAAERSTAPLTGTIELRNVTFGYDRSLPPLISNLSLRIEAGRHIAIVGRSGCGKSTLSMLIAGLYEPWEGEVLLDGRPVSTIDRSVLTGCIGVVGQDATLFEGTIADNIRMWDDTISDDDMIQAAKQAQLHDDIMRAPDGYAGYVSTGGHNMAAGMRQQLEIASALAKKPTILLLDEATAMLDEKTERCFMEAVREMKTTVVVIAHRLESIKDCDKVYYMKNGILNENA